MVASCEPNHTGFGDVMKKLDLTKLRAVSINLLIILPALAGSMLGKNNKKTDLPPFQYEAGTADLPKGCAGRLEVLKEGFTFKCPGGTLSVPFSAVSSMEFRPDINAKVIAMKPAWKVPPEPARVRENKYFTIVSSDQGKLGVVVFHVSEDDMRPYFAEIELQSGKSVKEYRSYEEFQ
jgi:hypothetical protein